MNATQKLLEDIFSKADSIKLYQGDDGLYYAEVYASEVFFIADYFKTYDHPSLIGLLTNIMMDLNKGMRL
jgi:hypothetical protein